MAFFRWIVGYFRPMRGVRPGVNAHMRAVLRNTKAREGGVSWGKAPRLTAGQDGSMQIVLESIQRPGRDRSVL